VRVATWNVNDIRKRLPQLLDWLQRTAPDVVALQELKTPTADFPVAALAAAGYAALVVGQRTWNGVALLARGQEPLAVSTALPGDPKDKEARYAEAAIDGVLFACLYLPNGNPCPGPKFDYKLRWFERLQARAAQLQASGQPVVLLGDWNVVPTDADIYKPDTWRDNALLQPEPRAAFARLLAQGWTDALAHAHPQARLFTFWDYRRNRWQRDAGLRIDHILVNGRLAIADAGVDRDERGADNPSDHAPAWARIAISAPQPVRPGAPRKTAAAPDPLARYRARRDFAQTPEPAGERAPARAAAGERPCFVVQKHWASRLHYDLRLELDGVLASWAIPKGPSLDPAARPIAIQVEDHPLAYADFEGTIPKGQYGAGRVIVWDRGGWEPVNDPRAGLAAGKLVFRLHGQKLAGLWELVRISKAGAARQDEWLLLKKRGDAWARPGGDYDVITALPDSILAPPTARAEARPPPAAAGGSPADDLARAVDADLPARLAPQLATAAASVPAGAWLCETKLDGYRLLARIEGTSIRLFTRAGNDWTTKFKPVVQALRALGLTKTWLDGEIVVMNERGIPDFNRLQNAIDNARTAQVQYFLFDAPYFEGKDLRRVPLRGRRSVLEAWLAAHPVEGIRFSQSFEAAPMDMLAAARQLGLEGVMVKRADSPYEECRTATWLKLKCQQRQEFVVIGFTDRSDRTTEVGSLLLAYHEGDALHFAGSVGAGWDAAAGSDLHRRLSSLATDQPAIDPGTINVGKWSRRGPGAERWVRPTTVVEIRFSDWTPDGHIRHAVFCGVREDKPAREVGRETRAPAAARDAAPPAVVDAKPVPGLKITHPERVIDTSTGLRKIDLVRYYASIAPWMLPHLANRPVSLVRAPQGVQGELFFQKHPESKVPGLTELDPALWPGQPALLAVNSAESLVAAAQLNTIELHTWNSTTRRIALPDRFILDLDPGDGVAWPLLQEAALLTRAMLAELGLESWLKTSGGKGLHVVVPLTPKDDYETVKDFSQAVVRHMAKVIPSRFVAVAGGGHRVGKVFIDYLRNGQGQTTACAFSARARPGLGVSMPVGWDQLGELKASAQWTVATAREYMSFQSVDPWAGYWTKRQTLATGRKVLAAAGRR